MRKLHRTPASGPRIPRRDVLAAAIVVAGGALAWRNRHRLANMFRSQHEREMAFLQNAYYRGQVTEVNTVQKITSDDARGCIVANANGEG